MLVDLLSYPSISFNINLSKYLFCTELGCFNPVNTANDWADEVKLFCEGKLPLTDYSFLKQDNMAQTIVTGIKLGQQKIEKIPIPRKQNVKGPKMTTPTKQSEKVVKCEPTKTRGRPKKINESLKNIAFDKTLKITEVKKEK